jgi:DNA-directed RNA polymerase I subunit RPA12
MSRRADTSAKVVVTQTKSSAFPSSLRAKRSDVQQVEAGAASTRATIQITCEKCGREEVRYYEQQLRSADEGATIFYICDCGNK